MKKDTDRPEFRGNIVAKVLFFVSLLSGLIIFVFIPEEKVDSFRSWIQDYKGKGHEWYRFMAKCVDYEGGITFPYNRVNKFRTYLKVKLRKDHGFKER